MNTLPYTSLILLLAGSLTLLLGISAPTKAHGPLHETIDSYSDSIEEEPESGSLYLHRAELHRMKGDWAAAKRDLARARQLHADPVALELCEAALALDRGEFGEARTVARRVLQIESDQSRAFVLVARAEYGLGNIELAVQALAQAAATSKEPDPGLFLRRSQWCLELIPPDPDGAVTALSEGIERIGPHVSLLLPAIEIDCDMGRFGTALDRVDLLEERLPQPALVSLLRGEILDRSGRSMEALVVYSEGIEHLRGASTNRPLTAAQKDLLRDLEEKLADPATTPRETTTYELD